MKGAREYSQLFKTGQYGRLYITSSSHARGNTFRIQVLPKGEEAQPNGDNNICLNKDAVEVYGVIGGNPGWTEFYGWKYEGPWQSDFEAMVLQRKAELETEQHVQATQQAEREKELLNRERELLASY